MPEEYIPFFLQIVFGIGFAAFTLSFSVLVGKRGRRSAAKDQPYECGKDPIGEMHSRFSVKFYLVAMLFILFDIEVVFMYPWAMVYRSELARYHAETVHQIAHTSMSILYSMFSFIGILAVGYLYALKKKAFDWTHNPNRTIDGKRG
jgi:NADH-quinone oxidoreductase subunit A